MTDALSTAWARTLFRRSIIKQKKVAEIRDLLGETEGLRCLDLGSDNGLVSLLLREQGGRWASADLTEEAVSSIRQLVGSDVHRVTGEALPFPEREFDRVVVVDMLEHVADDRAFIRELARVTKPGGTLLINTPHLKRSLLRRLRHALGQTDETHGHVRPGYTSQGLRELLESNFDLVHAHTYSRFFSEVIDTVINVGTRRSGNLEHEKGTVMTSAVLGRKQRLFRLYALLYPVLWLVSRLDLLIPWASGYMLIAQARRRS